jgi:hypothetical protein
MGCYNKTSNIKTWNRRKVEIRVDKEIEIRLFLRVRKIKIRERINEKLKLEI